MIGMTNSNIDALTFDRQKINLLLDKNSKDYTNAYDKLTDLEDEVKVKNAELYLSYKTDAVKRSADEIKALITTNPDMRKLTKELNEYKKTHLKTKTNWDKLKTKIMLLQSELKQNLEFNSMSEG
tara:strand:- start:2313 stop:2687 length:375 start_codon:yes stop_codon:yes gene_type:complete